MSTISLRMSDEDTQLLQSYVSTNHLNLSSFIRDVVMEKIEDDLHLDEERILHARALMKKEKLYDQEDVWKELDV